MLLVLKFKSGLRLTVEEQTPVRINCPLCDYGVSGPLGESAEVYNSHCRTLHAASETLSSSRPRPPDEKTDTCDIKGCTLPRGHTGFCNCLSGETPACLFCRGTRFVTYPPNNERYPCSDCTTPPNAQRDSR